MVSRNTKKEITLLHDITEVSKRSVQFVGASLSVALGIILVKLYLYEGHYLSLLTLFTFCIFLGILMFMLKKGYTKYIKTFIITGINIFLLILNFTDGLKLGRYLFFFPLLFALPFFISSQNKYTREVLSYFLFTITCFVLCISFFPEESILKKLSEEYYNTGFTINAVFAIILSMVFSYLGIYFERKYSKELLFQKSRKEDAMKARSQFLSQMGHELRTPMNGIIGATNLLAEQRIIPGQGEYLDILKYCSNHMLELINNIFDYNKLEAGKLVIHSTEVNLKRLLQNSVLPFYNRFEEKRVELRIEIDECLDKNVIIDDIRIIQILNNLLSNALKFTDTGHVTLKVSCEEKENNIMNTYFMVEDTGIGIDKKDFNKVFESFEQVYSADTRKYEGTGLGLNITQRLLNLMDSKLELESEPGKGSKFSFSIRLFKTNADKLQGNTVKVHDADLSGIRILIAEDNLINMLVATKMLQGWNASLTTAENGIQVLQLLEINDNYNLILMDLEMPEMDGYAAAREIKKRYPFIPILAYTAALIDQEMYIDLKETGFVDAVLKPCQPLELISKIRRYANCSFPPSL